ncbi:MAG: STAS domain-containing protein, partial [Gammaproteobacteria bacterium]|nr:STAS domain-containing protein [Gammaproteobacteria bacterium]
MQLAQAEITQQNKQKYLISGTVDFSTVPGLMRQMAGFFKSYKQVAAGQGVTEKVRVDLSQITDCNSVGLALMLEMAKDARSKNIALQFENLPDTLLTIAKAYGV